MRSGSTRQQAGRRGNYGGEGRVIGRMGRRRTCVRQPQGDRGVVPRNDETLAVGEGITGQRVIELVARKDLARIERLAPFGEHDISQSHQQRRPHR